MPEQTQNPVSDIPELRDRREKPQGVVPKQSQAYVVVAVTVVILLAVLFSNRRAKPAKPAASTPLWAESVPINNQAAIQQLQHELSEQQSQAQQEQAQAAKNTATADKQTQTTTTHVEEKQRDPIADAERALKFKARFASNLVVATDAAIRSQGSQQTSGETFSTGAENLPAQNAAFQAGRKEETNTTPKRPTEINLNSAIGQSYALFEGTTVDSVLVNRLNGDFSGPVKVMVTNPVYSQNRQHVLISKRTILLGEVQKVSGFGQRRLAVIFHRMIMPDGYSVDLDQFHGLDQAGETGIADKVNHHYFQTFGASIALGVIAGAAESTTNTGLVESGSDALRQGMASSLAQSSAHVLDRFLNILPEITIREGHRIKVYFTEDLLLPAYENHRMPSDL
jgi:type IV secretory pathway VirB10-like protein